MGGIRSNQYNETSLEQTLDTKGLSVDLQQLQKDVITKDALQKTNAELGNIGSEISHDNKLLQYTDSFMKSVAPQEYSYMNTKPLGLIESALSKTRMNEKQIENNAALLKTGAIGTAVFLGLKWIFTGSLEFKKKDTVGSRILTVIGAALGGNMLSQALTGKSGGKLVSDIVSGRVSLSDVFAGKTALPEARWGHMNVGSAVFGDIPYGVLSQHMKKQSNGTYSVDVVALRHYLEQSQNTVTGAQKEQLLQKIQLLGQIAKEPDSKKHLDKTITDLGIAKDIVKPTNATKTINENMNEWKQREIALNMYETTNGVVLKDKKDPVVIQYLQKNSPTLDTLVHEGYFVKKDISEVKDNKVIDITTIDSKKEKKADDKKIENKPTINEEESKKDTRQPYTITDKDMDNILAWNSQGVQVLKKYNDMLVQDKSIIPYIDAKNSSVDIRGKHWYAIKAHGEEVYVRGNKNSDNTVTWDIFMPHMQEQTASPIHMTSLRDALELAHMTGHLHNIDRTHDAMHTQTKVDVYTAAGSATGLIPDSDKKAYIDRLLSIDK